MWTTMLRVMLLASVLQDACAAQATSLSAQGILNRGIEALGGLEALQSLHGISYHHYLFRTQTLEESKVPGVPDQSIAESGSETISYDFTAKESNIVQRIDRHFIHGDYWTWARPQLGAADLALVVKGGDDGFSCYVTGNQHIFLPVNATFGYNDGYLTNILVRDAERLSPLLLLQLRDHMENLSRSDITFRDAGPFPALHDDTTNLTVAFHPTTNLPYLVRAYEEHDIFGSSTNDFVLLNYTNVQGMMVPQTVHLVYNEDHLLLHVFRDDTKLNPQFPSGFFNGLPIEQVKTTFSRLGPNAAASSTDFGPAEVFENSQNMIWSGPVYPSLEHIIVTKPMPSLPNLYHVAFSGSAYTQTVGVFDEAVLVTDAPPHQSKVVIEWIQQVLGRNVTHLLLTHHHHDHSYGTSDFVKAGAKLVVPEDFTYYWQNIPAVEFEVVRKDAPFIYSDSKMQMRAIWHRESIHCDDWLYFTWTDSCPSNASTLAATFADIWSPGSGTFMFDQAQALNYLAMARQDRMPYSYTVLPTHGVPTSIEDLYNATGYNYPKYSVLDFVGRERGGSDNEDQ